MTSGCLCLEFVPAVPGEISRPSLFSIIFLWKCLYLVWISWYAQGSLKWQCISELLYMLFHDTVATSLSIRCLAWHSVLQMITTIHNAYKINLAGSYKRLTVLLYLLLFQILQAAFCKRSHNLESFLSCFSESDALSIILPLQNYWGAAYNFLSCLNFKQCPFQYSVPQSWFSHLLTSLFSFYRKTFYRSF